MNSTSSARPEGRRTQVSRLTDGLVILLIFMPWISTVNEPPWFTRAAAIGVVVLALVIVVLRWNEVGADGRREGALKWYQALLFAVAGGAMWVAFASTTMMSRVGGVFALGMATLAVFEFLRVRRKA